MEIIVNGYVYPFVDPEVLTATLPHLTFISIFTYGITDEGDLVPLEDAELLETIKDSETLPLMVLTSLRPEGGFDNLVAHRVFNDPALSDRLIENIVTTVMGKGYAGIDFDFEFLLPEDRVPYADFVNRTRQRLNPLGKVVAVALAPKTYAEQPGLLYESHDYGLMGKAANLTLLMTYEWGYMFGPPMAVAPVNQVRRVLEFGITKIPRYKILMGIPNYGYDWTLPYEMGTAAEKITNTEAVERAIRHGAVIQFDELAQTPFYHYFDSLGREHEVWFENAESIKAKLNLVAEFNLAGVSYWNLMNYFPENWRMLNSMFTTVKLSSASDLLEIEMA